jgi:peroxiredoxin
MRLFLATLLSAIALSAADPGQRAPGFALPDSKLDVVDLYDFRGKPVIVEFMKTDCPHCAAFASVLQKVRQKYGDRVGIISIANPPDTTATVAKYVQGHGIDYPVVFDAGQAAYSYVRKGNFDLPQVYLIDGNGIIFNHYGYSLLTKNIFEGDGMLNEIERLYVASKPAAPPAKAAPKTAAPAKK